jgi:ankyrin repeat protein
MDGELQEAIYAGDLPWVRLLVQGGASIPASINKTRKNISALNFAAILGRNRIIEWLLAEGGANIYEVDAFGYNTLMHAANHLTNENVKTVQWLQHDEGDKACLGEISTPKKGEKTQRLEGL